MSSALFGSMARTSTKNLVEFKAGKMNMKEKMVHSDSRKGMVYVYQSDDQLMHFCWKDRTTGNVEDDLIIFPEDCEYVRIQKVTTGRVYVLKFKSNNRRLFFWMQEPSTDKDDEFCRKINDLLNNPPTPGSLSTSSRSSGSTSASSLLGSSNLRGDPDLQNLIGNISQAQLMQILNSGVPEIGSLISSTSSGRSSSSTAASTSTTSDSTSSTTTTTAAGEGSKAAPIQLQDLQNILSSMASGAEPKGKAKPKNFAETDLTHGLTQEALQPLLTDEKFVEALVPFLPSTGEEGKTSALLLKDTFSNSEFQQSVGQFSHALATCQLGPLMAQFKLGDDVTKAAASGNMETFCEALRKKKTAEAPAKVAQKDDDDNMAVD